MAQFDDIELLGAAFCNTDFDDPVEASQMISKMPGAGRKLLRLFDPDSAMWLRDIQHDLRRMLGYLENGEMPEQQDWEIVKRYTDYDLRVVETVDGEIRVKEVSHYGDWIRALFLWLIRIANGESGFPNICQAHDCRNIFWATARRSHQLYCSKACKKRVYYHLPESGT